MELIFDGKLPENIILEKAEAVQPMELAEGSLLIQGDNLEALAILLKKYRNKIDLIYIDPPFNTDQDFFISEDGRANTVSHGAGKTIAYHDKMSMDEYLEFLRERLILLRELLSDQGSIYVHLDCKVGHYVKIVMDEVFGRENFRNDITRIKSNPKNFFRRAYGNEKDLILFYAKDASGNIWNDLKVPLEKDEISARFSKIDEDGRRYTTIPLHAPGTSKSGATSKPWRAIPVPEGRHWRTDPAEFDRLDALGQIEWSSTGNPRIKKYADQHQGKKIQDIWRFKDPQKPVYPTEKNSAMLERIIRQSSTPDSIVLDCFAGSGATLKAAHRLGRVWIGIDSSPAAVNTITNTLDGKYTIYDLTKKGGAIQ